MQLLNVIMYFYPTEFSHGSKDTEDVSMICLHHDFEHIQLKSN